MAKSSTSSWLSSKRPSRKPGRLAIVEVMSRTAIDAPEPSASNPLPWG